MDPITRAHLQIGVGRDDGDIAGEFTPIFFRRYVPDFLDIL
jgi:hypothetical protein